VKRGEGKRGKWESVTDDLTRGTTRKKKKERSVSTSLCGENEERWTFCFLKGVNGKKKKKKKNHNWRTLV